MATKTKRIFFSILASLLAVVTVVLAFRAVLNYTGGRKLAAYLEKAKADGVAMKMKDLVPDCPDSDNGAPLWKAAEALIQIENKDRGSLSRAIQDFFDGRSPDIETRRLLAALVEKNRRVLDLMVESSKRTCFRYQDWSRPAYEATFLGAVNLIQATRLLAVDAVLRADDGDIRRALDQCLAGMSFNRLLLDEPFLIKGLIALADMKICLIALNRIMSGRDVPPDVLTAWTEELDPLAWRQRFARILPGERAFALEAGLDLVRGNPEATRAFTETRFLDRLWTWLTRPMIKSELIWVQRHYEGLKDVPTLSYYQIRERLEEHGRQINLLPWYSRVIGGLLPDYQSTFMKEATLEAMMLATKAGLACKIYKNKTGSYPERLEALVPEYLSEVPVDPFTGKPFVFRLSDDEILIYSLGSNGKDDAGRGTYLIDKMVMEKDDDWTWREKVR